MVDLFYDFSVVLCQLSAMFESLSSSSVSRHDFQWVSSSLARSSDASLGSMHCWVADYLVLLRWCLLQIQALRIIRSITCANDHNKASYISNYLIPVAVQILDVFDKASMGCTQTCCPTTRNCDDCALFARNFHSLMNLLLELWYAVHSLSTFSPL